MELTNEFRVGIPVEECWTVLTDVERIAPCMPGAELREVEGEEYRGVVKVKVGPVTAEYKGAAHFVERDDAGHRAVLRAEGRETRGQGNADATIIASLEPDGEDATKVSVVTDLAVSGKVAQFGRGVLADVSAKLLTQFVDCLEATILGGGAAVVEDAPLAPEETPVAQAPVAPEEVLIAQETATVAEDEAPVAPEEAAAKVAEPVPEEAAEEVAEPVPAPKAGRDLEAGVETGPAASGGAPSTEGTVEGTVPGPASSAGHNGVGHSGPANSTNGSVNGNTGTEPGSAPRGISMKPPAPVDLLEVAGGPVAKRLVPALVAAVLMALGGALAVRRWRR